MSTTSSRFPLDAIQHLGRVSDRDIAAAFGVERRQVARERQARGIGPHGPRKMPASLVAQLGTRTDASLAREYGFRVECVRAARARLGIPALHRHCEGRGLSEAIVAILSADDRAHTVEDVREKLPPERRGQRIRSALYALAGEGVIEKIEGRPMLWVIA